MNRAGSQDRYINTTPGPLRDGNVVVFSESALSSYAIAASAERVRRGIKPADTNGLPGWLVKDNDGQESYPNPDLDILAGYDVVSIPDANVWQPGRGDLWALLQRFDHHLLKVVGVRSHTIVRLPGDT